MPKVPLGGGPLLLLATFFFSLMQVCVRLLEDLPLVQVLFFRSVISIAICWILLRRQDVSLWGNSKGPLILRGLLGSAALYFYFYSLQELPFATAVSVHYLTPLLTVLVAGLALKEVSTVKQWLCLLAAFLGVLLIQGPTGGIEPMGLGAGVLAALVSAFTYNLIRSLRGKEHHLVIVFYFPLVTIPLVAPWTYIYWQWPTPTQWVLLIAMGGLAQLAQILLTQAYIAAPAKKISIFQYSGVVLGLVFSSIFFDEVLTPLMIIGGLIIIISGALSLDSKWVSRIFSGPSRGSKQKAE